MDLNLSVVNILLLLRRGDRECSLLIIGRSFWPILSLKESKINEIDVSLNVQTVHLNIFEG